MKIKKRRRYFNDIDNGESSNCRFSKKNAVLKFETLK